MCALVTGVQTCALPISSGGAALVEIIGHAGGPYDPPLRLTAIDDDEVAVDEAPGRGGEIGNRLGHVPGVAALLHRIGLMETLQRFFGVHDKAFGLDHARPDAIDAHVEQHGSTSCRERVGPYV